MKKILTILIYSFIIILLTSCGKEDDIENIGTQETGTTKEDGLSTTPGIEKQSYSNGFTQ